MITVDADGNPLPASFAGAVQRGEQTVLTRLQVDFDGDGYAGVDDLTGHTARFTVDRSLATDLPPQVRLAAGYSAAQLDAELTGGVPGDDSTSAAAYFTRGSPVSPIGGKERIRRPVVADVGYLTGDGPVYVRRFTGLTRALPTSAAAGTASLTALDLRERLRNTVTLIPTNGEESGADGTWLVTQALYANGIGAGPLPRADSTQVWHPMYGSLNSISTLRDPAWTALLIGPGGEFGEIQPTFKRGPFVTAVDNVTAGGDNASVRTFMNRQINDITWDGLRGRLEMWVEGVTNPTTGITGSQGRTVGALTDFVSPQQPQPASRFGVKHDGKLFFDTHDAVTDAVIDSYQSTMIVPGDGGFHFVGISWDFTATQQLRFRLDDREETVATSTTPATDLPAVAQWWQFTSYVPVSDIHVHGPIGLDEPWLSETVDVRAYLDLSALRLVACYEDLPRESWELATEVAAAEQAVALFDETGIFRYRTRRRLVDTAGQTVQRILTADAALLDVGVDDGIDQIRNIIQTSYQPVVVDALASFVYTDTTHRIIPPWTTVELAVSFNNPVLSLQGNAYLITIADFEAGPALSPYIAATLNSDFTSDSGAVMAYYTAIRGNVSVWSPRAATFQIINGSPATIYVAATALAGIGCTVGNRVVAEARDQASIDAWGAQPLQIDAPQWVQHSDVAQSLANALLGDLKQPRRTIGAMAIVGDPRLQLADRVAVEYPTRTELDGEYWLTAIADTAESSGGYTQQVALREATTVLRWGVGRWGMETWGEPS